MTRFLEDILRQPAELHQIIERLRGPHRRAIENAAEKIRKARHFFVTGIGASWHAALSVQPMFQLGGRPVHLQDAAELWQFSKMPASAVLVAISRSGRSLEIVRLLAKAHESGALVVGITNSEVGPLAREADIPIVVPVEPDHAISVNTYSSLAATAGILASVTVGSFDDRVAAEVLTAIDALADSMPRWQEQILASAWPARASTFYFLGRGSGLGSCHEARLLWEEGVKSPATAMSTSSFRHGPQEMVARNARFGVWIDARRMRQQDLAVVRDLTLLGARVMAIGQSLAETSAELVFYLPAVPAEWQFLIDIVPAQLAAEHSARLAGVDPDSLRYSSHIVESEYGLLQEKANVGE